MHILGDKAFIDRDIYYSFTYFPAGPATARTEDDVTVSEEEHFFSERASKTSQNRVPSDKSLVLRARLYTNV